MTRLVPAERFEGSVAVDRKMNVDSEVDRASIIDKEDCWLHPKGAGVSKISIHIGPEGERERKSGFLRLQGAREVFGKNRSIECLVERQFTKRYKERLARLIGSGDTLL